MLITARFAILLGLGAIPLGFVNILPGMAPLGVIYISVVLAAGIADLLLSQGSRSLEISRICDNKLSLGVENPITISVQSKSKLLLDLIVRDEPPHKFAIVGNVFRMVLHPRERQEVTYHVSPHARGDYSFGDFFIRLKGPLGLTLRQFRIPGKETVKVYPNILELRKYDLLVRRGRKIDIGMRRIKLFGRGTEFESLRDYVPDDEFRQVDWKASARKGKLISRQYQVERSQNIVILLDAGRTMSVRVEEMTKLDYAINSALLLAYVATSGDDKVGLLTFSGEVDAFIPPGKGRSQAIAIMQSLYNIPLTTMESDYAGAFLYLTKKWRKRSLLVVFSDLLDPESSRQIIMHMTTLAKSHLCMCVTISDTKVLASSRLVPKETSELYEKAAALDVLHERQQAIASLEHAGVIVVNSEVETLSPSVIEKYLEIKTRLRL